MIPLVYMDRRLEGKTPLRQCQLASLHLLHVLDRVCEENGLRYWLAFGTLLGAVRHKGFIPWDDDVDVYMTMADFKKLSKIADAVLPKDVIWQDPWKFPPSDMYFGRMRDVYSTVMQFTSYKQRCVNDPQGVPLDIFPIEDVHVTSLIRLLQKLRGPLEWRARYAGSLGPVTMIYLLKKWFLYAAYFFVKIIWNLHRSFWRFGTHAYVMVNCVNEDKSLFMPYDVMEQRKRLEFEDGSFWAPSDPHEILKRSFSGDYMMPVRSEVKEDGVYLPTTPGPHNRAMKYTNMCVTQLKGLE